VVNVVVPFSENGKLASLFRELETNGKELGVSSFGVSLTTLEDVFVKMTDDPELLKRLDSSNKKKDRTKQGDSSAVPLPSESGPDSCKYPSSSAMRQFIVALRLNLLSFQKKNMISLLLMMLLPAVATIFLCSFCTSDWSSTSSSSAVNGLQSSNSHSRHSVVDRFTFDFSALSDTLPYVIDTNANTDDIDRVLSLIERTYSLKLEKYDSLESMREYYKENKHFSGGLIFSDLDFNSSIMDVTMVINDTCHGSYGSLAQLLFNGLLMGAVNDETICGPDNCPQYLSVIAYNANLLSDFEFNVMDYLAPVLIFVILFVAFTVIATIFSSKFTSQRETMLASQLVVCSMRPTILCLANLLSLFVCFLINVSLVFVVLALFRPITLMKSMLSFFVTLTLVTIAAMTPVSYLLSLIFKKASSAGKLTILLHVLVAMIPVIIFASVTSGQSEGDWSESHTTQRHPYDVLGVVLGIFPTGMYSYSFFDVWANTMFDAPPTLSEIWEMGFYNKKSCLMVTAASGVVYFILALVLEHFRYTVFRPKEGVSYGHFDPEQEDDDVHRERLDADSVDPKDVSVLFRGVRKVFGSKVAVESASLALRQGSCFSLLGPNGAGKSTLVNMLTGELRADGGSVFVRGIPMVGVKSEVFRYADLSRCMQDDTVMGALTPRQHMTLLHDARCSCSEADSRADVQMTLETLGMSKYADQPIETLSGGNCRKLSVAAAMLPKTRTLIFDEPSTGMDPMTRRLMWKAIEQQKEGRCLLLTTHSMEEAEAVSDSIGIIAHGELQCVGNIQHLRSKFNNNYHLNIELAPDATIDVTAEIVKAIVGDTKSRPFSFPVATPPAPDTVFGEQWKLLEAVGCRRTYELKVVPAMSTLFEYMEANKERCHIHSYSLTQASLEDIFLQLVRKEEGHGNADAIVAPVMGPNVVVNPTANTTLLRPINEQMGYGTQTTTTTTTVVSA